MSHAHCTLLQCSAMQFVCCTDTFYDAVHLYAGCITMVLCDCVMAMCNSPCWTQSEVYDASLHSLCYVWFVGLMLTLQVCVMHHCVLAAMYGLWVSC